MTTLVAVSMTDTEVAPEPFAMYARVPSGLTAAPTGPLPTGIVAMTVFARGLLNRLFTRVYLPVDRSDLAEDPFLLTVPEDRRATLVATADEHGYRFDVRLQGENETVFLQFPGA